MGVRLLQEWIGIDLQHVQGQLVELAWKVLELVERDIEVTKVLQEANLWGQILNLVVP